ncbi:MULTISPECIES: YjdF family protein [Caproicibacterium]|uniref:YjdF family protein n=1 Tax=Caproicibacterium argilliputei TaxID=3030016 RepID=A0AA97D774_9FIRM|nr:YjdF family protein [Caproicibacterium argilliputei]WOC31526.1 YjdF family protein [Caproicibacterium argilliputei]
MNRTVSKLTVYFEEPFWVAVWERSGAGVYEAGRFVFGAQPKDNEVYAWVLNQSGSLRFGQSSAEGVVEKRSSPKREQRAARRLLQQNGVGTKAQQALKLQQEQGRQARRIRTRTQKEADRERLFALREQKRREKHRGH